MPFSAMDSYRKESDSRSEFDIFEQPSKQKEEAEQKKVCRRVLSEGYYKHDALFTQYVR